MTDIETRRRRLALSYLAVIMTMSLIFSSIIYGVLSSRLDAPLSPRDSLQNRHIIVPDEALDWINNRDKEMRASILVSLGLLNLTVLCGGIVASYLLAKRTLRPIEEAMESQQQFISDASHELRTPLTALQATNEIALRKKKIDDQKAREVLQKNIIEVSKMRTLTDSLLSMTGSRNISVQRDKIWIDTVVTDTVSSLEDRLSAKRMTVDTMVEHAEVLSNELRLGQIITALVDNAIKYSPKDSKIKIVSKRHKQSISLEVQDNGQGIAMKDQPYIFDRFYRADEARTRTEVSGYGLGLAIAKTLAEEIGADLSLKASSTKKGTVFVITIPLE